MKFLKTGIKGCYKINKAGFKDNRGMFIRTFCKKNYSKYLNKPIVQSSLSINNKKYTLRGIHYQLAPHQEDKILHLVKGKIYAVILDLRKNSETFLKKKYLIIDSKKFQSLIVARGCANGFMTLQDETIISYQMTSYFSEKHYRGIKYNDKFFKIKWPHEPTVISENDLSHPDFNLV